MNLSEQTITAKLDRLPPCVVRLLAKKDGRLMTDPELCALTGWGRKKLESVYQLASWAGVRVGDVDTFLTACGLSWATQRRQRWLLKLRYHAAGSVIEGIRSMRHMKTDEPWRAVQVNMHLARVEKLLGGGK